MMKIIFFEFFKSIYIKIVGHAK